MVAIKRGQREASRQVALEPHRGRQGVEEEEEEEEDAGPVERCPQLVAAEPLLVPVTY